MMEAPKETYPVENRKITCVEHPFIVKNPSKVLETLGGHAGLGKLVRPEKKDESIELRLRPDDHLAAPVISASLNTDNLLIQIQVPKLTGRKRKRGSDGPFLEQSGASGTDKQQSTDAHTNESEGSTLQSSSELSLPKRLRLSQGSHELAVLGAIRKTHRFRSMQDYVFSTTHQKFMQRLRQTVIPMNYDDAKKFAFDSQRGFERGTEMLPPPQISHFSLPINYSYHQNPAVRQTVDTSGEVKMRNDQAAPKVMTGRLHFAADIPHGPHASVTPLEDCDPTIQTIVRDMKVLFERRPIWTRRAITNEMKCRDLQNSVRHAFQYVGYTFKSGPWRDAVIKYGVDPRLDPNCRWYQTMMFQFEDQTKRLDRIVKGTRGGARIAGSNRMAHDGGLGYLSHKFDGEGMGFDGRVWQVCDITDPVIRPLLETTNIRSECEASIDGWYQNGTWAKARVIAKVKLGSLRRQNKVLSKSEFTQILTIPDVIDDDSMLEAQMPRGSLNRHLEMAATIRHMAIGKDRNHLRQPLARLQDRAEGGQIHVSNTDAASGGDEDEEGDEYGDEDDDEEQDGDDDGDEGEGEDGEDGTEDEDEDEEGGEAIADD